ncbi:MAG: quinone-interacting membrane-bound oxidoreductase complex subunit QmoC [Desulfocapsa sp.]|nr:quinone-interacting membrane-bound oxidoreductase complex subunit QmoC [Desulfocapsa sp.]
MNVQPDLDFIKYLKTAGGDTMKKCYQCATCSVVCPLSTDEKPFPRQEMIWAGWGMKDKLLADPNVLLCHQCGDCTAYCPRGAKPGDVLGAIRAYTYAALGWPAGLAKLASSAKGLPMLIAIPAVIIFVLWAISGGMSIPGSDDFAKYGYQHFFGHWDFHWLSKNVAFIDFFMLGAAGLAVVASYKGITTMWAQMCEREGVDSEFKPSLKQLATDFLWPSIVEIVQHNRFRECVTNRNREVGHKPLMWAFGGLFIVTVWSAFANDVLGLWIPSLHGPMSVWNPVKILANVSAVAMIVGCGILWMNRAKSEAEDNITPTFYDWFLIWEIMAVGVTGLLAEVARWAGLAAPGYILYYIHLVTVMMLFMYMPYTKFAHLIYRTTAMTFEKYRESAFVKNPLDE